MANGNRPTSQEEIRRAIMEGGLLGLGGRPQALQRAYQEGGLVGLAGDVGKAYIQTSFAPYLQGLGDIGSTLSKGASNIGSVFFGGAPRRTFLEDIGLEHPETAESMGGIAEAVSQQPNRGLAQDFAGYENPTLKINPETGQYSIVSYDPHIREVVTEEKTAPPIPSRPEVPRFDFSALPPEETLEEALARFDVTRPTPQEQLSKDEVFSSILGGLAQGAANVPRGYFPPTLSETLAAIGAGGARSQASVYERERLIKEGNLGAELDFQKARTQFILDYQSRERERRFQEEKIKYAERMAIYDDQVRQYEKKYPPMQVKLFESGYAVQNPDGTVEYVYNAEAPGVINARANMVKALGGSEEDARAGYALQLKLSDVPEELQPAHKAATEVYVFGADPAARERARQMVLERDREFTGGALDSQIRAFDKNALEELDKRAYLALVHYFLVEPREGLKAHNRDSGVQRGLLEGN